MIPRTLHSSSTLSWQEELKKLITCPKTLYEALDLAPDSLPKAWQAHERFRVRVTPSYLKRIRPNTPNDPLLQQILPSPHELTEHVEFVSDPLAESLHNPVKGLIHKYQGRVLFITAGQCAINCRYCFRREFDYSANSPNRAEWSQALAYIQADSSIKEVILSGGDPLTLSDNQLQWLIQKIADIPHITRLRLHTRIPIVLPSRITPELVNLLTSSHLKCIVVMHSNHAQELDNLTHCAFDMLKQQGITLLNQAVLLAGINDSESALVDLSEKLFNQGVLPYYLHVMDKVRGTKHFDLPESQAVALHKGIQAQLPGFLVPKLVREIPGQPYKTPLF